MLFLDDKSETSTESSSQLIVKKSNGKCLINCNKAFFKIILILNYHVIIIVNKEKNQNIDIIKPVMPDLPCINHGYKFIKRLGKYAIIIQLNLLLLFVINILL